MFAEGGQAYVYLIYGIHHLFNVVTHQEGEPYAVLVRAIEPLEGIELMLKRRSMSAFQTRITAGPGALSQAMGITKSLSGCSMQGPEIWLENRNIQIPSSEIISTTRVGVAYAGEDALLPYRFLIKDNPFVSKGKGL